MNWVRVMIALVLGGCQGPWPCVQGGLHKAGERVATGRAFYGEPITGHALAWNGLGDVPVYGVGLQNYWFWEDRLAVGAGVDLMQFDLAGTNAVGAGVETRVRYFYGEIDNVGGFFDFTGGYRQADKRVPAEGTDGNFTFSFGPGFDYRVREGESVLLGLEFHHMSNGRGRDTPRNPSQNELLLWFGYGWSW